MLNITVETQPRGFLAWQATGAVADTDAPPAAGVAIAPLPVADGAGVVVSLRF